MTKSEIIELLKTPDSTALFRSADQVRRDEVGDAVELRALLEISNHCQRNCLYCGIRRGNSNLFRYRMTPEEILAVAREAASAGFQTLVIQSGEDAGYSLATLCDVVRTIKMETDLAITLSLGEKTKSEYAALRAAGADRYLLKIETTDEDLFKRLKPDSSFPNRVRCLHDLLDLGFQTGCGSMVGLPGQTLAALAEDILFFQNMNFDMIGIGPFIPHPETPLADAAGGTVELTLKVVAITRLLTRNAHLPATTAIASLDSTGREKALAAGANVIMPNITPIQYREHYQIYPGKVCSQFPMQDNLPQLEKMLQSLGRTISRTKGHSLKYKERVVHG